MIIESKSYDRHRLNKDVFESVDAYSDQTYTLPTTMDVTILSSNVRAGQIDYLGTIIQIPDLFVHDGFRWFLYSNDIEQWIKDNIHQFMAAHLRNEERLNRTTLAKVRAISDVEYDSMDDVVTTNAKKLIGNGIVINNPMSSVNNTFKCPAASAMVAAPLDTTGLSMWSGSGSNTGFGATKEVVVSSGHIRLNGSVKGTAPASPMPDSLYSAITSKLDVVLPMVHSQVAVNQAFGNVDPAVFQLPVTLAEGRKTADSIIRGISRLLVILRKIRTGRFKELAPKTFTRMIRDRKRGDFGDFLDYVSDAWLEARYAWRPLVYEINGALALLNGIKPIAPRQTFRGYDETSSTDNLTFTVADGGVSYVVDLNILSDRNTRAGVLCESRFQNSASHRLGLWDLAGTAWELVPFSFVIDWIIDISSFINALRPNPVFKSLAAWKMSTLIQQYEGTVTYTPPGGSQIVAQFSGTRKLKERANEAHATYINLDVNLDIAKIVDLAALLRKLRLR